jgi:glucuronide carrier protein
MTDKLSRSLRYTFGVGDMLFILMVDMELFYFTAFLTDYAQFSMATISVILWITGVLDIVCALAAGIILQNTTLKFGGKYRSWFLIGPPLFAPLFVLQFTKLGSQATAACIIITGFVLSHLLYNVVFTASGAIVSRLSRQPQERTILSTSRSQGWSAAGVIFSLTALPMITFLGSRTDRVTGFTMATAVYAVLMITGYLYVYRITAGRDRDDASSADPLKNESRQSLREVVRLVFSNRPLLLLVGAETFRNASASITMTFAFYYFTYVLKDLPFLSVFMLATSIAILAGAFCSTWIGVRIGKRNSYWISLLLSAASFTSALLFGRDDWSFTAIFCIALFFANVAGSMNTALFSDASIYGNWKTGKDISAFTMALLNFPIKLAILIRSAVVTIGLVAIGFVANAVPGPRVVTGISVIMTLSPAIVSAVAAMVVLFGYTIKDEDVVRMQNEIAERGVKRLAATKR